MPVANVVMFEFETSADLENWAEWYKRDGPFPNNEISLFVKTNYSLRWTGFGRVHRWSFVPKAR
ncbi:MAG: hypothetical protein EBW61_11165 [Rhodobacteraceae bacterium]|nr:hypothetical protein [Paracoccaceae bacterium]